MKTTILLLALIFTLNNTCAQDHPADCNLPFDHDHSRTVCYGYAMARAFGKSKLWPDSNKVYTEPAEGVDLNYFQTDGIWYSSSDVVRLNVSVGNIIVFYNTIQVSGRMAQHASYVAGIASSGGHYQDAYLPHPLKSLPGRQIVTKDAAYYSTNLNDIIMHEIPNRTLPFAEKTLQQVIEERRASGPFFRIFNAKNETNIQVTYHNSFPGKSDTGKMSFIHENIFVSGLAKEDEREFDVPHHGVVLFRCNRENKSQGSTDHWRNEV